MEPLVSTYLQLWNETDAASRAGLLAATFTHDATYQDPLLEANGRDAIDGLIGAVHARFPGFVFTPSGSVDVVGDHVRFSWNLGPRDGHAVANGTDFARFVDGRFASVVGFLNPVGAPEEDA